ncbi:DVU_1556 family methyltransferase [Nitratidesulfovibrio sp. HK-II]|uniref:DVU_1556 family methyltransferase n=1 Tax=Nitratidesulfovibrio sp. HK-II TaxID=2009266 RepID=UPI003A62994B
MPSAVGVTMPGGPPAPKVAAAPADDGGSVIGQCGPWEHPTLRGPWEHPMLRAVAGPTLRPGGVALTWRALELARQLTMLPHDARVMDLGCGPGETVALLREGGMAAVGLDLSASLLDEALARNGRMPLIRADAGGGDGAGADAAPGLPLRTATLDGVFCECVLSVLPQRQGVLAELARVLRPGGVLVWTDLYVRPGRSSGVWRGENGCPDNCPDGYADGYAARGESRCSGPQPGVLSCRAGAMPRADMEAMLRGAGFTVLAFEDHSRLLAELAGRLLFAGADPAELFGCGGAGGGRPGYALLLARRNGPARSESQGDEA